MVERSRLGRRVIKQLLSVKGTLLGCGIMVALALVAIFAPILTSYDPIGMDMRSRLQPPSAEHLFGTDEFGRDVFTRVVYGARLSFQIAIVSVAVASFTGIPIGAISGYVGGRTDFVIQRGIDIALSFPGILFALAIVAVLGPSMTNVMIAVGLGSMPFFARLVRGAVLKIKQEMFIEASRALGTSDGRILLRHVIPNATAPIIVLVSQQVGWAILQAAALSFLGLGAQPPIPEWGTMLSTGRDFLYDAWWIATFPGIAIAAMVLGFNLMGDGLRDILDPQQT